MLDTNLMNDANSLMGRLFSDPTLAGRKLNLSAGEVVYEPDASADSVFLIHRGQVRLYQVGADDSRLVEILGPDEWFGVGAVARQLTHESRAVAVVPTLVTAVSAERLFAALSHRPEAALEFTRQLAAKLQAARDDAAQLVFQDCTQRLIRTLVNFSRSAAASTAAHEHEVVLKITHNQLAQAVGVARETVSLALTQLRHQNLLRTGRNQLIFNPEALRNIRVRASGSGSGAGKQNHSPKLEQVA